MQCTDLPPAGSEFGVVLLVYFPSETRGRLLMNSCGYELGVAKASRSGAHGTAVRLMLYSQMGGYGKNSRLTRYARGGTERDGPPGQSRRAAATRQKARPPRARRV